MTDPGREASDTDDGERDGEEYEVERRVTRDDGATVLRILADGVANGSVELSDEGVVATVPERFSMEVEYEREDESAELEVELEWPLDEADEPAGESEPTEPEGEVERVSDGREQAEATELEATAAGEKVPAETDATDETDSDAADGTAGDAVTDSPIHELVGVGETGGKAQFEVYRDEAAEWRWRLVHDNGNIIADSGEGYDRKAGARKGLESVKRNAPDATVSVRDD